MSLEEGYRSAQAVTRAHAKSFHFASILLFGARRRAAFALYAACRRLDDLVDGDGGVAGELPARLAHARAVISSLYGQLPPLADPRGPYPWPEHKVDTLWPPAELMALQDTIQRFAIPEAPFQDLISGMEMDLTQRRYPTAKALELYCYRVAGTVGLMLFPVLGGQDAQALTAAASLGQAMQLTNIVRDVQEDLERDRIYLPADELAAFGITEDSLRAGTVDARFRGFLRLQVQRARAAYARAEAGLPFLRAPGAQRMVRLMGALYGGILEEIEALGYDVFRARAHVPLRRKLWMALRVVLSRSRRLPRCAPGSRFLLPEPVLEPGDVT